MADPCPFFLATGGILCVMDQISAKDILHSVTPSFPSSNEKAITQQ